MTAVGSSNKYPWISLFLITGLISLLMALIREFIGLISCLNAIPECIISLTITVLAANAYEIKCFHYYLKDDNNS